MHRLRTLAATLTLACGLSLALTACGDDDEPTVAPAPTSEATSTATTESASDSPTVVPEDETAREFIERWLAITVDMQKTGETASYTAIIGPDCESCRDLLNTVRSIHKRGGYIDTEVATIDKITKRDRNEWLIDVVEEPTKYRRSRNAKVERFPGGAHRYIAYIGKAPSGWIVASYYNAAS
ncbi:hypothetical protein FXB39_15970 [Nocardioides sp. BGMRC 2183]|nr:hypothetical protein FXB39_15970 [Nocardioides sp. BGMRC 2183]